MEGRRNAVIGWLLLLPAAVLLVAFTHYPAVATLWHSLFSTAKPNRPARFIGACGSGFRGSCGWAARCATGSVFMPMPTRPTWR